MVSKLGNSSSANEILVNQSENVTIAIKKNVGTKRTAIILFLLMNLSIFE